MKQGSKYYPLFAYLEGCNQPEITLSISEIETIIGNKLPASAWSKKAWWSNRNSSNALQAAAWIDAGYHTQEINLSKHSITFCKFQAQYKVQRAEDKIIWNSDSIKALRQHMGMNQIDFAKHLQIRQQTVSEWEQNYYTPKRSTSNYLDLIAKQAGFIDQEHNQATE